MGDMVEDQVDDKDRTLRSDCGASPKDRKSGECDGAKEINTAKKGGMLVTW